MHSVPSMQDASINTGFPLCISWLELASAFKNPVPNLLPPQQVSFLHGILYMQKELWLQRRSFPIITVRRREPACRGSPSTWTPAVHTAPEQSRVKGRDCKNPGRLSMTHSHNWVASTGQRWCCWSTKPTIDTKTVYLEKQSHRTVCKTASFEPDRAHEGLHIIRGMFQLSQEAIQYWKQHSNFSLTLLHTPLSAPPQSR